MEKAILYRTQIIGKMNLEYYIIISENFFGVEGYGARIIKTEYEKKADKCVESSQVNNIFYKRFDIEKFMDTLVRNEVTPMSLRDIAEDYVVEYM